MPQAALQLFAVAVVVVGNFGVGNSFVETKDLQRKQNEVTDCTDVIKIMEPLCSYLLDFKHLDVNYNFC